MDEIQSQPRAITALKCFAERQPNLAVIGSGSLLGVSLRQTETSFPVGKVQRIEMHPMTFDEFLRVRNGSDLLSLLAHAQRNQPLNEAFTQLLTQAYHEYLIIGGMPEVVRIWLDAQDALLFDSVNDFATALPLMASSVFIHFRASSTSFSRSRTLT